MTRLSTLFSIILPSMLAGGLLFGSAFGHADAGRDDVLGFWPATTTAATGVLVAQGPTQPVPPVPPMPPMPPMPPHHHHGPRPPMPPMPPSPPHGHHHGGVSVSMHDGKLEVDGVKDLIAEKLEAVREMLRNNTSIPPEVREKILRRLDKVHGVVDRRLSHLHVTDMDQFGEEMEQMGNEIEQSMEGLGSDLQQLGDQFGKNFGKDWAKSFKKGNFSVHIDGGSDDDDKDVDHDDDDDDKSVPVPDVDADDSDMKDAIKELGALALKPAQRDQIAKLRTDSDRAVATAKRELDNLSSRLHDALANPGTSDADIARYVDQISSQEATIRKARILAWANARRVLDEGQRKMIEDTAKGAKKSK